MRRRPTRLESLRCQARALSRRVLTRSQERFSGARAPGRLRRVPTLRSLVPAGAPGVTQSVPKKCAIEGVQKAEQALAEGHALEERFAGLVLEHRGDLGAGDAEARGDEPAHEIARGAAQNDVCEHGSLPARTASRASSLSAGAMPRTVTRSFLSMGLSNASWRSSQTSSSSSSSRLMLAVENSPRTQIQSKNSGPKKRVVSIAAGRRLRVPGPRGDGLFRRFLDRHRRRATRLLVSDLGRSRAASRNGSTRSSSRSSVRGSSARSAARYGLSSSSSRRKVFSKCAQKSASTRRLWLENSTEPVSRSQTTSTARVEGASLRRKRRTILSRSSRRSFRLSRSLPERESNRACSSANCARTIAGGTRKRSRAKAEHEASVLEHLVGFEIEIEGAVDHAPATGVADLPVGVERLEGAQANRGHERLAQVARRLSRTNKRVKVRDPRRALTALPTGSTPSGQLPPTRARPSGRPGRGRPSPRPSRNLIPCAPDGIGSPQSPISSRA